MTPAQKIIELKTLLAEAKEALMSRDPRTREKECYDSGKVPCACTLCKIKQAFRPDCPRCEGRGIVWGRCCSGLANECGCMGYPVDIECHMCNGSGRIDNPLPEEAFLALGTFLDEQREIDDWVKELYESKQQPKVQVSGDEIKVEFKIKSHHQAAKTGYIPIQKTIFSSLNTRTMTTKIEMTGGAFIDAMKGLPPAQKQRPGTKYTVLIIDMNELAGKTGESEEELIATPSRELEFEVVEASHMVGNYWNCLTPVFITGEMVSVPQVVLAKISMGGAIAEGIKVGYPEYFNGRIPLKVRMNTTVQSDTLIQRYKPCRWSEEYYVQVNSYGAVTAIHEDGSLLGLKPGEFQIIAWHE